MEGSKPWYESKAVWGGVVALASPIAAAIGHRMEPADQAHLVDAIVQLSRRPSAGFSR